MKRIVISVVLLVVIGLAAFYFEIGVSAAVKRDRALSSAKSYLEKGKVDEAIIELKNALKADPASPEAHHELGLVLMKKGDIRTAYAEFVRATDLKPDFIKARYQLATLQLRGRDTKQAKQQLEKLRAQDKDSEESRYLAAQIAMAEKDPDTALYELQEILKKDPGKSQIYLDMGMVHAGKNNFKAAEGAFRKALELDPKFHRARVALATLYALTGEQGRAEEELIIATKEDPENEELLHVLGNFYSSTRRSDDLEILYRDLLI